LQDDLLAMLADGQYALADIADHYSGKRQEEALQLLGHLMEEGLIERNEDGMLILVKGAH
jgi:DNA-binding IclR family transcriptional regulator